MARTLKDGATIGEVAVAAGVSRATVSRVMNGRSTVAADIAQRVRAAAEELAYRPSTVARSLSLGRTNTVALVMPDVTNPMFQQILRGAMAAAASHGYRVLVAETAENQHDEAVIALEARLRCDALILVAPRMSEDALLELLPQVRPVVLVDRAAPSATVPVVSVDYARGITAVVDHLVGLGHRELAYVAGPRSSASNAPRLEALQAAVQRHRGISVEMLTGGSSVEAGYGSAERVLDSGATGVVSFNDLVAFGLLLRLNETGVAVPGDISVAGFDDIELARYPNPALTTAAIPQTELGRRAWERLHEVISAGVPEHAYPGRDVLVPHLVVRSSTGPVPPARRLSTASSETAGLAKLPMDRAVRATWELQDGIPVLQALDVPLARYVRGDQMPAVHSPRPHLHPVHSLQGIPMTQASPADHRHHYGLSMAVADIDGTSYWGGRTFLPGQGPTLLANHGRQVSQGVRISHAGASVAEDVAWLDQHGRSHLSERRTLTGVVLPEVEAWAFGWSGVLSADQHEVKICSPATNGRPGAGFGGLFWRLPGSDETHVLAADADDATGAHGSRSPWVALARRHLGHWTTLVLAQPSDDALPWFIRVSDYVGVGPALAWDTPLIVPQGDRVAVDVAALVVDRRLGAHDAADLADLARARIHSARSTP